MIETIQDYVGEHALRTPNEPAIVAAARAPLTYGRLADQIRRVGERLGVLGIRAGDRVAVVLPDGADAAVAILAVAASATCAPLNPAYSSREFASHFAALRAKVLLVPYGSDSSAAAAAKSLNMPILQLRTEPALPAGIFSLTSDGESVSNGEPGDAQSHPALLLLTSGTAARPKLVPLTHPNLCVSAQNICSALHLHHSDRCLGVMPLFHIHGLSTVFASLISGGSYAGMTGFSTESFFTSLHELRPTWYSASPTIHRAILDQIHLARRDMRESGLRFIRSASAPMPQRLIADVESAFGVPFIEAYGMTEAAPQIASNRLPPFRRKPGSVGTAAGPEVVIMDDAGRILPAGEAGEVAIRGRNVIQGYDGDPALDEAAFSGGWLRTGDVGHLDVDGYLFVTGRLKEIINRGGEKISPQLVEQVLLEHPAIVQAVVFGVPHSVLGEDIAAAVVLKSAEEVDQPVRQIRDFMASRMARFEVPQQIVVVDRIPLGPTGKLNRNRLAEALGLTDLEGRRTSSGTDNTVARTPTERRVAELFAEALNCDALGIHDDFFELGGHSLAAMQVLGRLQQIFQLTLPLSVLFESPTVAKLSERIGEELANLVADGAARLERKQSSEIPEQLVDGRIPRRNDAAVAPLSFAQQSAYFLDRLGARAAYNMSAPLWLTGSLDERALALSLDEIRRRHDILRTNFQMRGDRPVQVVAPPQPIGLAVVSLTTLTPSERGQEAMRLAIEEAARPFDLANEPLFRAKLIKMSGEEAALLLTMHHIVSDGWSLGVLFLELKQLYEAFREGRASPLEELPIQYGDFAAWQRRRVEEGGLEGQITYWTRQIDNLPPLCTFPADRPRPALQSYRGATEQVSIDRQLIDRLKAIGRRENVTLFITLLAAFTTLLFRYNGQDDCVVGVPITDRPTKELESLVGFFINTVAMRTTLAGDPSFVELLARIRSTALGAYTHQAVPLERIMEECGTRDLSRTPLFQVMFVFNAPDMTSSAAQALPAVDRFARSPFDLAPGLCARPFRVDNNTAKFDLTLYLSEAAEGLSATWQFNTDLFEPATIRQIASHFHTLLEGIAAAPGKKLSELPLAPEADLRQVEIDCNRTDVPEALTDNFVQVFERQVERTPDAIAVLSGDRQLTYRELNDYANQFARHFRNLGVAEDTLVGVCLPRSAETLAVLLGVWKAGGAFLPLDIEYPAERIAFIVRDAGASLFITQTSLLPKVTLALQSSAPDTAGSPELVCVDACRTLVAEQITRNLEGSPAAEGLAYLIYTSGSTGRPKGAMITHANVCHYAQAMARALGLQSDDRYLHTASFSFSSSVRQFSVPLSCGAAVSIASGEEIRDPQVLFETIRLRRVTVLDFVPSFSADCLRVLMSLDPSVRAELLDNDVRLMLSASEPLPSALVESWRHLSKPRTAFINMFGQTETTGIVTTYSIPTSGDAATIVPIGRPIANTQTYVLDNSRRPVPVGIFGELYIGGRGIGRGYVNQPEQTAKSFVSNPFGGAEKPLYRTGDLARYRADGIIEILGRVDQQIKIRGFRIEPGEIEEAIRTYPGARECVVSAIDDSVELDGIGRGKCLVAFVAVDDAHNADQAPFVSGLRDFIKRKLPDYMLPQRIVTLDRLLRTPNGKIDRQSLLATLATRPALPESRTAGRSDVEKVLVEVWKKVLRLDSVDIDDNFFDLGGNSSLSISVIFEARQAGLEIDLRQFYQYPTIAKLAHTLVEPKLGGQPIAAVAAASSEVESGTLVTIESLRAYGREALVQAGLSPEGAEIVTEVQLEASLRGQPTHDMSSIPRYARRIATGKINARPHIQVERETANTAQIDGDNGPGQWISMVAMQLAIRKAHERGIGIVGVRRSNHFGAAGHYAWEATKTGLIGLCTTNGPVILAPTGGMTPTFGNNPLGVGIPAGRHPPILLDIAMSVAPRGKIGLSVAEGRPLSPDWILDRFGRPSNDLADLAAGLGVPIGGHKGYGLALVMEALAGALTGAGFCGDHRREKLRDSAQDPDYGHFFMAIDPQQFMPAAEFTARVDGLIEQTKSGERAANVDEIFIPGEMELLTRDRSLKEGVLLRVSTYQALVTYGLEQRLHTRLHVISMADVSAG